MSRRVLDGDAAEDAALSTGTTTDFAVEAIRRRIVLGQLLPGAKLRVDQLAHELNVSRVPVREAFRELLAEGLVEIYPRRGAVVAEIRKQDVHEGYRMLELMEVMAAERVITADPAGTAGRMRGHLDQLDRLVDRPDPAANLDAHRAFHFEVFTALGPGLLQRTARMMWHTCERYINASTQGRRTEQAHREHVELMRCFAEADAIAAVALTRMHVAHGREAALRGLGLVN